MEHKTPFGQAVSVLPPGLRDEAEALAPEMRALAEELRLRAGQRMTVLLGGRELSFGSRPVTGEDLRAVVARGSQYSVHTVLDQVCSGFLTLRGGHRIGLCGEAAVKEGKICGLRSLSSLAIRIARPVEGAGEQVIGTLVDGGALLDTLILSPPGGGKTTLLRDLVRRISDGMGIPPQRVGLADSRREVSALWEGIPQFDVGRHTDIMADCTKSEGVQILVRGMNPQVIAMDEVTAAEDLDALLWAAGCGVKLLVTAHGTSIRSMSQRPLYRKMLELKLFCRGVIIGQAAEKRSYHTEVLK